MREKETGKVKADSPGRDHLSWSATHAANRFLPGVSLSRSFPFGEQNGPLENEILRGGTGGHFALAAGYVDDTFADVHITEDVGIKSHPAQGLDLVNVVLYYGH